MKKAVFSLIWVSILAISHISAQNPEFEKINSYRIGFFTKRLDLNSSEAEKFWPVYNEFQDQRRQILEERIKLIREFNQNEKSLSDNQMAEMGDKLAGIIAKESELALTFHKKLKEALPPAKVIRFYQAENQYKAQLLNELQNRQQNRPMQRGQMR